MSAASSLTPSSIPATSADSIGSWRWPARLAHRAEAWSANPAIFPLFYECDSLDVLLVLLSPLEFDDTPRTMAQIKERVAELAFSSNFMREMQTFARAATFSGSQATAPGGLENKVKSMRFHMIDISQVPCLQRTDTKLLAHGPFLDMLYGQGREQATAWRVENIGKVGVSSTIDVNQWVS